MSRYRSLPVVMFGSVAALAMLAMIGLTTWDSFRAVARQAAEDRLNSATIMQIVAPRQAPAPARTPALPSPADSLAQRPLASAALARAGLAAATAGRHDLAAQIMTEVVRRDPRSSIARLWLLTAALKANDIGGAIKQLDRLNSLNPHSQDLFPVLAELARQPAAEGPLTAVLAMGPGWRDGFISYLSSHDAEPQLIFRLTMKAYASGNPGTQTALINQLVLKGDYDGAYLAWINFLPESSLESVAAVYDGGFVGLPGPLPFNWTFSDSSAASVGIERGVGLQIDYPSARTAQMASQLLVLKAGQYRIDYVARGSGEADDGGVISWRLTCAKGGATLFDLPIVNVGDSPTAHSARFAVSAGCPAQTLSLEGTAGAFPKSRSLTIRRVAITALR